MITWKPYNHHILYLRSQMCLLSCFVVFETVESQEALQSDNGGGHFESISLTIQFRQSGGGGGMEKRSRNALWNLWTGHNKIDLIQMLQDGTWFIDCWENPSCGTKCVRIWRVLTPHDGTTFKYSNEWIIYRFSVRRFLCIARNLVPLPAWSQTVLKLKTRGKRNNGRCQFSFFPVRSLDFTPRVRRDWKVKRFV